MLVQKLMALGGYTRAEDLERDYPTMKSFIEAFPQAQKYINQYKKQKGGNQQDPLMMVISAVADQIGIDPNQLAQLIQQSPEFMTQLSQLAAQDPNQAAKALMQVVQNAAGQGASGQGQGQMAQQEMAQPGEMPMNPEEAMQMAYGGANLKKFIRKTGGAAPMYDNNVYRTFPPNMPRLFGYGGMYQAPTQNGSNEVIYGPYNIPEVVIRPESQFGNGYYSPMGPRVGPFQEENAELSLLQAALLAGGAGGLYMGSPYFGSLVPGQNEVNVDALTAVKEQITEYEKLNKKSKDKKKMSAEEKTRLEDLKKKGFGAMASDMTAWSGVATPYYGNVVKDHNKTHGTNFKTFGDLPADVRERASINAQTLYYFQKNNPKAFKNMRNLANMYPNMDLTSAATAHMNKNPVRRLASTTNRKLSRTGKGGLLSLATMGAIIGIDKIIDEIRGPKMDEEVQDIPLEQVPADTGTQMEEVQKENTTDWGLDPFTIGISTTDPNGQIVEERYGGTPSYAYGGGTPFGYGYFPPIMYAGGTASPGIMDVDSELSNRNNTWLSYVRNNVQKAAMPESFRLGGYKKKKN